MNASRRRFFTTVATTIAAAQSVIAKNFGNLPHRLAVPVGVGAASAAGEMPPSRWSGG